MTESEIFAAAAAEPSPEQRQRLLDELCAGQPEVKGRIETLLKAHDRAEAGFLRGAGRGPNGTQLAPPVEDLTSTRIGHYKLLQKLGEGGFGVVYMAEQQEPVRRKVAFKVIRPGMDSREVIARFESERQALALMDHPNIAQVFDAGTSPRGQPYFVMELVRGVPITDYCDRNRLPVADRLKLFISVCQAVQHAHHKGVIHRDIKPSNVMVTLHDGVPVVKVIDFGVAKATSQRLTEKTLFTQYGQMVGTPAYMSPEQAEMSGLDIDTRSDVYSLGVLLYELLTGSTPLEDRQLREAGWARLQQLILDHEPPLPSLRVSSRGGEATVLANNRGVDLRHLTSSLRGDLDWIVMKSLEKDRNRRYVTPSSLAAEIDRYLQGEAIEARAPSLAYRAQRLFRKHRPLVLTALVITGCLLTATVISTLAALRATEAERVSDQKRREAEESRAALQTSLEETQTARREAESLTSQVIAGQMTSNFDEALLLHWLDQLPRLSDSQRETRQYVKHCLLGALQTVASLGLEDTGTVELSGSEFAVDLRVLAFDQGLMAFTQTGTDITIARIAKGEVVYHSSRPGTDWGKIATVEVTPECVVIMAVNGKYLGLDRGTWRTRYTGETPAINQHNREFDWKHGPDRSVLVGRYGAAGAGGVAILETATGTSQQLPLPFMTDWDMNAAGDRLVAAWSEPNRLAVWTTHPLQQMSEIPLETEVSVQRVQFLLGGSHALVVSTRNREPRTINSQIWSLDGAHPSVQWRVEQMLRRGPADDIIGEDSSSSKTKYLLTANSSGLERREIFARVALANADWLVDDSDQVYSRETLQPEPRPSARGYSPHLQEFAIAGRYLHSGNQIVDLTLNLTVPGEYWQQFKFDSTSGHVLCGNPGYFQVVLPVDPDTLSHEQLAALVQLVVCGEREASGQFRPWGEAEWQSRLQQAEARGWLDVTRFPHLVAYLKQPAFWWKHEITRPRPGVTDPKAAEQQINQAWRELFKRDSSLAGQLKCLDKIRGIENWSAGEWRAQHLRLARQFGREYWEERWSRSVDLEEAAQETLTDHELSNLAEYLDLRRAFLRQYAATLAPVIPGPYDALGDSLVLIRQGKPKQALQVIELFLAEWEEQSPNRLEDSTKTRYLAELLTLQLVAHARQEQWAECRAVRARLDRELPPLEVSSETVTPTVETTPNPSVVGRSTLAKRLSDAPGLLLNLLDESLTQLESQGQPPDAPQPPASP